MAKRDDGRVGREFEKELKKSFDEIKNKHLFDFHRFTDTKAAGRYVGTQPADYMISFKDDYGRNRVIIVEAKASEEKESLRACASSHIEPAQIGKHKSWLRSGGDGQFWFYCESTATVELWSSSHVVAQRAAGKPLDLGERLHVFGYLDLTEELINYFGIAKSAAAKGADNA